jgi:hypothetical protein
LNFVLTEISLKFKWMNNKICNYIKINLVKINIPNHKAQIKIIQLIILLKELIKIIIAFQIKNIYHYQIIIINRDKIIENHKKK